MEKSISSKNHDLPAPNRNPVTLNHHLLARKCAEFLVMSFQINFNWLVVDKITSRLKLIGGARDANYYKTYATTTKHKHTLTQSETLTHALNRWPLNKWTQVSTEHIKYIYIYMQNPNDICTVDESQTELIDCTRSYKRWTWFAFAFICKLCKRNTFNTRCALVSSRSLSSGFWFKHQASIEMDLPE